VVLFPQKRKQLALEVIPELRQAGLAGSIHVQYQNESLLTDSFYAFFAGNIRSSPPLLFSLRDGKSLHRSILQLALSSEIQMLD
jgi:hypothetical protein